MANKNRVLDLWEGVANQPPLLAMEEPLFVQLLAVIQRAADAGDAEAEQWLNGEGYIRVSDEGRSAAFVRFDSQDGRHSVEAKEWSRAVMERDKFCCTTCGEGGELQSHHIKSWSEFSDDRFDVSNGTTLCRDCHAEVHPEHAALIKKARYAKRRG